MFRRRWGWLWLVWRGLDNTTRSHQLTRENAWANDFSPLTSFLPLGWGGEGIMTLLCIWKSHELQWWWRQLRADSRVLCSLPNRFIYTGTSTDVLKDPVPRSDSHHHHQNRCSCTSLMFRVGLRQTEADTPLGLHRAALTQTSAARWWNASALGRRLCHMAGLQTHQSMTSS